MSLKVRPCQKKAENAFMYQVINNQLIGWTIDFYLLLYKTSKYQYIIRNNNGKTALLVKKICKF